MTGKLINIVNIKNNTNCFRSIIADKQFYNGETSEIEKKIVFESLEVHPTEPALIINCKIEALFSDKLADSSVANSKETKKIIRFKGLDATSEIDPILSQVINRCEGILNESHRGEIKQSISYLKNRSTDPMKTPTGIRIDSLRPKTAGARISGKTSNNNHSSNNISAKQKQSFDLPNSSINSFTQDISNNISINLITSPEPSINNLDEYIEYLYEELAEKIKGTAMVYELSKDFDNLQLIIEKEALICALSRLLREEGRKSIELSSLIVAIFANLSLFSQFHSTITKFKVGSICIELIRQELEKEMTVFRELAEMQKIMANDLHCSESFSMASSLNRSNVSTSSAPPNSSRQNGIITASEYEKCIKKYQSLIEKQNLFLRAAFYLLLNLSEDKNIEIKMVSKGIVVLMVKVLERENWTDLLNIVLLFLKKLSVYEENKEVMVHLGISGRLANIIENFVNPSFCPHVLTALEVMHNLAFDRKFCHEIIGIGIIQRLLQFLYKMKFQFSDLERLTYQIMYVISSEEKIRIMFNMATCQNTNCINILANRLIKFLDNMPNYPSTELIALLINLSTNRRNAQLLSDKEFLGKLFKKVIDSSSSLKYHDILLLKLLRNLSQHECNYKSIFGDFLSDLIKMVLQLKVTPISQKIEDDDNEDDLAVIEIFGIIGNMENVESVDWLSLNQRLNLWSRIAEMLQINDDVIDYEDDLILQCIFIISTMCNQRDCCLFLLNENIAKVLINVLNLKQKDDEIVLQILFTFHQILRFEESRKMLLKEPVHVLKYFLDLLNDSNKEIKRICSISLNIIMEFEEEYSELIKEQKFKSYNQQWLEMVSRDGIDQYVEEVTNDYLTDFSVENYNFLTNTDDGSISDDDDDDKNLGLKNNTRSLSRPQTGYKTRPSTARASSRTSNKNVI